MGEWINSLFVKCFISLQNWIASNYDAHTPVGVDLDIWTFSGHCKPLHFHHSQLTPGKSSL